MADFQALESRLVDAEVRASRADLEELLAPEFREVGTSGRLTTREQVFSGLRAHGRAPLAIAIENLTAVEASEDVVVVTYRAVAVRSESEAPSISMRTSVWRRRAKRWQVVHHQGTRIS
ncbi:MAG: nuclear transport factor 2 family protein [Verrucomicrobiales bacterium]|nr:nuclear transport factor 2 family protein [Verrucomicrobiales bacterium]